MSGGSPGWLDASSWRLARVTARREETARAVTLVLDADGWAGHVAGQRVDLRLTAEDGYQATRAYSIASAPAAGTLEVTVERMEDGEVSPYLVDVALPGDELEVRGPIGGWFTWSPAAGGPLLLVGGGSGLVPLMAMVREAVLRDAGAPIRLVVSTRTRADLLYAGELDALVAAGRVELLHTLTRERPDGWSGPTGRIDAGLIGALLAGGPNGGGASTAFVCGPTGFVERAAELLLAARLPADGIRTERFGPSA